MSSSGDPPQEDTSRGRESRDSSSQRSSNIIEFVDSQNPNVRSAIQRHTAYHSAAQRREARSRLLRRSSQTRYFEWTRRPRGEADVATSSASSASSVSISPAPSTIGRPEVPGRTISDEQETVSSTSEAAADSASEMLQPASQIAISTDDSVLEFFRATFCDHYQSSDVLESALVFMLENEASRHLLIAYAYAMRRSRAVAEENSQDQVEAERNLSRGTNILWNRLQMPGHASSDANIQAVLLLVAYTADFGNANEVRLHADALRTMIEQRGGVDAFTHNPALHHQIWVIETSRRFHLTLDCESTCPDPPRFPDGLRLRRRSDES
ncbi:uncharacterized protein Z520_08380 [Fonsecaea multimorphosa CBS 102226]|uniref:Transcription factor domain-containing protein n=1 Tax=Fonsecaea multimorphosa CBS 102226 TaxID=1442371 RepID=A0A0D2H2M6_9EURO|nr:uncharacterized protein Z520_08380 [Fonsecaea multimorphosa CBS 102226]KIX96125.1 hypothetical protein Z520_08380 [Fonsecaea multimorphosa CBS 102226]OAL19143.1 hypothetical protein AYO22_10091 [Fonsecaea multimorphosa]